MTDKICDCVTPKIITQPSGRIVCEACGARMLEPPPPKVVRP